MTTTPGEQRSRLDPQPASRRDVLGLTSLFATITAFLFALGGMIRLPKAAVLASPSKRFRVSLPETLKSGEAFVPPGRPVALFRDEQGVYAISTVCTHLGCIVRATEVGFQCPCHGSKFAADGGVTQGPAPRALPWLEVKKAGGAWIVDQEKTVQPGTKVSV